MGEDRNIVDEDEIISRSPSFEFILFSLPFGLLGGFILFWSLVRLPIYYNYLRGAPSPIDQNVLALLSSDLSRVMVLFSAVIGITIGSLLSYRMIKKIDTVKREGEADLSSMMYYGLIIWWSCAIGFHSAISLIENALLGFPTSSFLSDIGWATLSGYLAAGGIPIFLKYFFLCQYANSSYSRVKLVVMRSGSGFKKSIHQITLKLVPSGPDP